MVCQHCGVHTEYTYSKLGLCPIHAEYYFPGVPPDNSILPDNSMLKEFLTAAEAIGYVVEYTVPDVDSFLLLTVICPHASKIETEGLTFTFGKVTACLGNPFGEKPSVRVYIEYSGSLIHPHVNSISEKGTVCIEAWRDDIQEALCYHEWQRAMLLIYESTCHYYAPGAYHTLLLPCAVCGVNTHKYCQDCARPYCYQHLVRSGERCTKCCPQCPQCRRYEKIAVCSVCGKQGCERCFNITSATEYMVCPVHTVSCPVCSRVYSTTEWPTDRKECERCEQEKQKRFREVLARMEQIRELIGSRRNFRESIGYTKAHLSGDSYRPLFAQPPVVGF